MHSKSFKTVVSSYDSFMEEGDESSRLRMANQPAVLAGCRPFLTGLRLSLTSDSLIQLHTCKHHTYQLVLKRYSEMQQHMQKMQQVHPCAPHYLRHATLVLLSSASHKQLDRNLWVPDWSLLVAACQHVVVPLG